MKYPFIFFSFVLFTSCATNHINTIEGKWKQEFLSYKSENAIVPKTSEQAIINIKKVKKNLRIEFDFNDGYDKDLTDSIVFNYPQLRFRKINLDKTSNYYTLIYNQNCDCFTGEMNSFSGNILNIKLNRIPVTK